MWAKAARALERAALRLLPARAQDALVRRRLHRGGEAPTDVEVVLADTPELLHAAARLTFEAYAAKQLVGAKGVPVRVTPYLLLQTTATLVALRQGEVIGTLSLALDSPLGLPLEQVFKTEVEQLREAGRRLAEVGALALKPNERGHGVAMLMYRGLYELAQLTNVQDLVIAVHPAAESIYRGAILFERLAGHISRYPGLDRRALAVGLRLNLETFPQRLQASFGETQQRSFNPRNHFLLPTPPQVRLTHSALDAQREAHTQSALRLACLRPETLSDLDDSAFEQLQAAVSEMAGVRLR